MMINTNYNDDELDRPSLNNQTSNKEFIDLILEGSEVVLDNFLIDGFLKELPIVGGTIKLFKATIGYRDRMFVRKIYKFLYELKEISEKEKEKLKEKLVENTTYAKKVSEAILLLIDKADDFEKPTVIGRLFKSFLNEHIDIDTFLRLSSIVNKAYIPDLKELSIMSDPDRHKPFIKEQLAALGILTSSVNPEGQRNNAKNAKFSLGEGLPNYLPTIQYKLSKIGQLLIEHGLKK